MSVQRSSGQSLSSQLATQVNWKIFELQSCLLGKKVNPEYMAICKKWFTPKHFLDIVEERSNEGICGYPLCDALIRAQVDSEQASTLLSSKAAISTVQPTMYCSQICTIKASEYMQSLDTSAPLTREVTKALKHHSSVQQSAYTHSKRTFLLFLL
jgi:hypothetical protein